MTTTQHDMFAAPDPPAPGDALPEHLLKCLSLTEPWAVLVMIPAKRIETRSWSTRYRGLLGIHAAKGFPGWARGLCYTEPFARALVTAGYRSLAELPLGALIGTVQLVDCVPVEAVRDVISPDERAFGDYSDGRFAWILEDPLLLPVPVPMKGALSLWTCTEAFCSRTGAHDHA